MPLPVHWVNTERGGTLSVSDRGFRYGDGLFETFRYRRGSIHLLGYHLARLQRGCERLDIPFEPAAVEAQLQLGVDHLLRHDIDDAYGRLSLSRGEGLRGYGGDCGRPSLVLELAPADLSWRQPPEAARLMLCETTLSDQALLAGIKHSNRLEQVLAARELSRAGADEGLMLNSRGELIAAVAANVFAVFDGTLLTPPVAECGIAGTVRQLILDELAPALGVEVAEETINWADLQQAEELFLTNALQGIRAVASCPGASFTSNRWGDNLRQSFYDWSELSEA